LNTLIAKVGAYSWYEDVIDILDLPEASL